MLALIFSPIKVYRRPNQGPNNIPEIMVSKLAGKNTSDLKE
jgi:hypothetical protein